MHRLLHRCRVRHDAGGHAVRGLLRLALHGGHPGGGGHLRLHQPLLHEQRERAPHREGLRHLHALLRQVHRDLLQVLHLLLLLHVLHRHVRRRQLHGNPAVGPAQRRRRRRPHRSRRRDGGLRPRRHRERARQDRAGHHRLPARRLDRHRHHGPARLPGKPPGGRRRQVRPGTGRRG